MWSKTHNFIHIEIVGNYFMQNELFTILSQFNVEKGRPGRGNSKSGRGRNRHGLIKDKEDVCHGKSHMYKPLTNNQLKKCRPDSK